MGFLISNILASMTSGTITMRGRRDAARSFHFIMEVLPLKHLGLNNDPSMSNDTIALILLATDLTGEDQPLPNDTMVKALVRKLVMTDKGVTCLVMTVWPYRIRANIIRPNPTNPAASNEMYAAKRTSAEAHF